MASGDIKGAVRILVSSNDILPPSPDLIGKLRAKHPSAPSDLNMSAPPTLEEKERTLKVAKEELRKIIFSFRPGSSGGQDGLTPQHLKYLVAVPLGEVPIDLLEALCNLINSKMLPRNIPESVKPVLFGAKLFVLSKSDGGIRPIAVGSTLRRLTAKVCFRKLLETLKTKFLPPQLGVGCPSGAEVILVCRKYCKFNGSSAKVILKIDFKNAFNTVTRDVILENIKSQHPELFPFVWECHAHQSMLFSGKDFIWSKAGTQQGPPDKSICTMFSVGLRIEVLEIQPEIRTNRYIVLY